MLIQSSYARTVAPTAEKRHRQMDGVGMPGSAGHWKAITDM